MATVTTPTAATSRTEPRQMLLPGDWTLADLKAHVGNVPLRRIRLFPAPGTATEEDALEIADREDRLYELVDGVLVEKVMGTYESYLAGILIHLLNGFLDEQPLGIVLAPDGALRILPTRMRLPDVSFIRWERFPGRKLPAERVFRMAPDLAIEFLSEGNTRSEMQEKLHEYFQAGVQLVWYIDPRTRHATAYTAPDQWVELGENEILDGGSVLPGFRLRLGDLLDRIERE